MFGRLFSAHPFFVVLLGFVLRHSLGERGGGGLSKPLGCISLYPNFMEWFRRVQSRVVFDSVSQAEQEPMDGSQTLRWAAIAPQLMA